MAWITILVGTVVLVIFFTIIGLVKSVLRLVGALAIGIVVGGLAYWVLQNLGLSEAIPDTVILIPGALAALSVLTRRR